MRWLEWGIRSYQSFVLGAALILIGAAVGSSRGFPRPVGYLMGLSGVSYLAQGWASSGASPGAGPGGCA